MATPTHFRLPLTLGSDGAFETIEQDTIEDVAQCISVVTATPIGSRVELPAFGIPMIEFSQPIPLAAILAAVYTWEPRAMAIISKAISGDQQDALSWDLTLEVN